MKLRITLTQQNDEIKGQIVFPPRGDGVFTLEALAAVIHEVATKYELPVDEVMQDLYAVVKGKVK